MSEIRKRNLAIEFLRIWSMILILTCHAVIHFDWHSHHVAYGVPAEPGYRNPFNYLVIQYGQVGVTIFFMITGFFLVNKQFHHSRLIKTWLQMFLYSAGAFFLVVLVGWLWKIPGILAPLFSTPNELIKTILASFTPFAFNSYWFIGSYLILLVFSPFLNILVENMTREQHKWLIILLLLLSAQSLFLNRTSNWNNLTYSFVGYLAGAWIRQYSQQRWSRKQNVLALLVIIGITGLMYLFNYFVCSQHWLVGALGWQGQIHYGLWAGPIIIGALIFRLVLQLEQSECLAPLAGLILQVAPTTFGIYLIHENLFGYRIIWEYLSHYLNAPQSLIGQGLTMVALLSILFCALSITAWIYDRIVIHPVMGLFFKRK